MGKGVGGIDFFFWDIRRYVQSYLGSYLDSRTTLTEDSWKAHYLSSVDKK
jgi:hypothetical protein